MANEKTYMARTQMKSDSAVNWQKATNFSPLKGEMIIYSGDPPRLKVGDGTTNVNDLPFTSAAIYVGDTAPTGNYDLWIDTSADTGDDTVQVVIFTQEEKTKLAGIEAGANKYVLPTAGADLGGVKTTSTVSDATGLIPTPIIDGVPYYKETEIAPDWNENDSASKNYVKNRPGGYAWNTSMYISISQAAQSISSYFSTSEGLLQDLVDLFPDYGSYNVIYNGTSYGPLVAVPIYATPSTGVYSIDYDPADCTGIYLALGNLSLLPGLENNTTGNSWPIVIVSHSAAEQGSVMVSCAEGNTLATGEQVLEIQGIFVKRFNSLETSNTEYPHLMFDSFTFNYAMGVRFYADQQFNDMRGQIAGVLNNLNAVSKSGDTMTGSLNIENASLNIKAAYYPSFNLVPTDSTSKIKKSVFEGSYAGSASMSAWEDDAGQNRRMLEVRAKAYESSLDNALLLRVCDSNNWSQYKVFHGGMSTVEFGGTAIANTNAQKALSTAQLRNITISTTDLVEGESTLAEGEIYLVYDGGEA